MSPITAPDLDGFASRKVTDREGAMTNGVPDSLGGWIDRYMALAVTRVRSTKVVDSRCLEDGHIVRMSQV